MWRMFFVDRSLLQIPLSGVDAVQQRVAVRRVAVMDLSGRDRFGFHVNCVFLIVRQVRVTLLYLHDPNLEVA